MNHEWEYYRYRCRRCLITKREAMLHKQSQCLVRTVGLKEIVMVDDKEPEPESKPIKFREFL